MSTHVLRAPDLDLPDDLILEILTELDTGTATSSNHSYKSTPDCFTERLIRRLGLGSGEGRVYRLSTETENKIKTKYSAMIRQLGWDDCKIRIKTFQDVNWVPLHADRSPTSPQGDTATVSIGLKTNGEKTHFYDWRGGEIFEASFWNILSCRRADTIEVKPGEAWLFDNSQPHSVTGFRGDRSRALLVIGWPDLEYSKLTETYREIYHD